MKILLDAMMSEKFASSLSLYDVTHVVDLGWQHLNNGKLLSTAESAGFDVLITKDANMPYQQNLVGRSISLVIVRPKSQDLNDLMALAPDVLNLLPTLSAGDVHRVVAR